MTTKIIITLICLFSYSLYRAQVKLYPEIGFAGNFTAFGTYHTEKVEEAKSNMNNKMSDSGYGYIGFNAYCGIRFQSQKESFFFQSYYQRSIGGVFKEYLKDNDRRLSDLLGIGIGVRFLEKSRFKPLVNIQCFSEVHSNYKNKYIETAWFSPTSYQVPEIKNSYYQGHGQQDVQICEATLYQSTPLLINVYSGCDVKLIENMQLNFSIGYNLSILNYKYATFQYDDYVKEDYHALLKNSPMRHVLLHSLAVQLGLSYTFSFKKKLT